MYEVRQQPQLLSYSLVLSAGNSASQHSPLILKIPSVSNRCT